MSDRHPGYPSGWSWGAGDWDEDFEIELDRAVVAQGIARDDDRFDSAKQVLRESLRSSRAKPTPIHNHSRFVPE